MNFDPKEKYEGGIVFGGTITLPGVPEILAPEAKQHAKREMEVVIPLGYRDKVTFRLETVKDSLKGEKMFRWFYKP